jgi:hypothetical protein
MTTTKSIIALGALGAMLVGPSSLSYARERPAQWTGIQKRGYTLYPRERYSLYPGQGYRYGPSRDGYRYGPPTYPNFYLRPMMEWDPYGMRWDGPD